MLQIYLPMHQECGASCGHWYLLVVDMIAEEGYVLDSMKSSLEKPRLDDCRKVVRTEEFFFPSLFEFL